MSPLLEVIAQILWVAFAIWLIHRAYKANKTSPRFSFKMFTQPGLVPQRFDDLFIAGGFVIGIVLLILIANKLLTCGLICGTLLP